MVQLFRRKSETDGVYTELVAALFTVLVPSLIMSATFVAVGLYAGATAGGAIVWIATGAGVLAAAGKLLLLAGHSRLPPEQRADPKCAARWEVRFAYYSWIFSVALGALAARTFAAADAVAQMLATGMLFGYCSGVVARTSVRPAMCFVSLSLAAVPVIVAAAAHGGVGYAILAIMFAAFLLGSFESVRHAYAAARQQIRMREELATVARHDELTGLANRFGLREAFRHLVRSQADGRMVAVHCLDLDRFKPVNDRYGHPAGDAVLRELAHRLTAMLRSDHVAARVGGDEFVVVQGRLCHVDEAELFARRLCRAITGAPYDANGHSIELGVSIGYTVASTPYPALDELLLESDQALYHVKAQGGGVQPARRRTAG